MQFNEYSGGLFKFPGYVLPVAKLFYVNSQLIKT